MKTLILNCSAGMEIYLTANDQEFKFVNVAENKHTDELLNQLDILLKNANVKINEIDNLCVCVGPGSFTGVRVAISICKGLAIGTNAKIFTASNLDIFKFERNKKQMIVLNGFSNYVYVKNEDKNNKINYECITIDELKNRVTQNEFLVYVEDEKLQKRLKTIEINAKIAENDIKNVFFNKIKNNENVQINEIFPIYLRASQAEIERNKKLG